MIAAGDQVLQPVLATRAGSPRDRADCRCRRPGHRPMGHRRPPPPPRWPQGPPRHRRSGCSKAFSRRSSFRSVACRAIGERRGHLSSVFERRRSAELVMGHGFVNGASGVHHERKGGNKRRSAALALQVTKVEGLVYRRRRRPGGAGSPRLVQRRALSIEETARIAPGGAAWTMVSSSRSPPAAASGGRSRRCPPPSPNPAPFSAAIRWACFSA